MTDLKDPKFRVGDQAVYEGKVWTVSGWPRPEDAVRCHPLGRLTDWVLKACAAKESQLSSRD